MKQAATVDEYIATAPKEVQEKLRILRKVIQSTIPEAEEKISYGMPYYSYKGRLAYFAVFKNHIGFYPLPSSIEAFKNDLSVYKTSKGGVQFPLDQPLPLPLIERMIKFRVEENRQKSKKNNT